MLLYELEGRRLAGVLLLVLGATLDEREQSDGTVSVRDNPGTSWTDGGDTDMPLRDDGRRLGR
jgi:hypothetical protein